jgi:hypothetical protein
MRQRSTAAVAHRNVPQLALLLQISKPLDAHLAQQPDHAARAILTLYLVSQFRITPPNCDCVCSKPLIKDKSYCLLAYSR